MRVQPENVTQLRKQWASLTQVLLQPETEDTWERLDKALKTFAGQLKAVSGEKRESFESVIAGALRETDFYRSLTDALLTERTRLSGSALDLLSAAAGIAAGSFGPCIIIYLPVLIKLLGRPNKIYVTRTAGCLSELLHNTKQAGIIPFLAEGTSDKSTTVRKCCVELVLQVLAGGPKKSLLIDKHLLDKRVSNIEDVIRRGATDKEVKIRDTSRQLWDIYKREWPDRVEDFSKPLTPMIRRYLHLPAATARPPSPPKFTRPARPGSPSRGTQADLKRSAPASLKTSSSTTGNLLSGSLGHAASSSRHARHENPHSRHHSASRPEDQPSAIDQLYDQVAATGSEPFAPHLAGKPTQLQPHRRPGGAMAGPVPQRSVSAHPELQKAKESGFPFALPPRPQVTTARTASSSQAPGATAAPSAPRRAPGRAVTAAPLASSAPSVSPEGALPPPTTGRPPSRTLTASAKPPVPQQASAKSHTPLLEEEEAPQQGMQEGEVKEADEAKGDLRELAAAAPPETTSPTSEPLRGDEQHGTQHASAESQVEEPALTAAPRPAPARPALANATNKPPAASRAPKKDLGASASRAAFKPKRPANAAGLGQSTTARRPAVPALNARPVSAVQDKPAVSQKPTASQTGAPSQGATKTTAAAPKPNPVRASPSKFRQNRAAGPSSRLAGQARARPAAAVSSAATQSRKVQSSTTRRINTAAGTSGVARGTAATDLKAKEARERRRKREEAATAAKSKAAPQQSDPIQSNQVAPPAEPIHVDYKADVDCKAEEHKVEPVELAQTEKQLPETVVAPCVIAHPPQEMINPFALPDESRFGYDTQGGNFMSATFTAPPLSLSPSKPPTVAQPPTPVNTSQLYKEASLPSPCIKAHLVPLPQAADASLFEVSRAAEGSERAPAPSAGSTANASDTSIHHNLSPADSRSCPKGPLPLIARDQKDTTPTVSAPQQADPTVGIHEIPASCRLKPQQEGLSGAASSRPSMFHWDDPSMTTFDFPVLGNETAEATMLTSQGYPGLESPGLEAVRDLGEVPEAMTPLAKRKSSVGQ